MKLSFTFAALEWRFGYEKSIGLIRDAGFDAFDYSLDCMVKDDSPFNGADWREHARRIRTAADAAGLCINQTHAPFSFSVSRLWSNDTAYREIIFPRIRRALEISGIFGADVCVVHPIHHGVYAGHEEELFRRNKAFYRELLPTALRAGVRIGVENMYQSDPRRGYLVDDTCSRAEEFCRYIDTLNHPRIVACLDLGHVGLVAHQEEAWDVIRALGHDRLCALHVHDNDYRGDQHQLPYIGKMDWAKITQALGEIDYQGDFTYENGWAFLSGMDEEFLPTALRYMADVGRHLMRCIDRNRPGKG